MACYHFNLFLASRQASSIVLAHLPILYKTIFITVMGNDHFVGTHDSSYSSQFLPGGSYIQSSSHNPRLLDCFSSPSTHPTSIGNTGGEDIPDVDRSPVAPPNSLQQASLKLLQQYPEEFIIAWLMLARSLGLSSFNICPSQRDDGLSAEQLNAIILLKDLPREQVLTWRRYASTGTYF